MSDERKQVPDYPGVLWTDPSEADRELGVAKVVVTRVRGVLYALGTKNDTPEWRATTETALKQAIDHITSSSRE